MTPSLEDLLSKWNDDETYSVRKVPICLLLDVSGSMNDRDGRASTKIQELNENLFKFLNYVRNDSRARKICDLCVITFGDEVKVLSGYTSIDQIQLQPLVAYGGTPIGAALEKAMELLQIRRNYYKTNEIEHYKPIILLMSDGDPSSSDKKTFERVAPELSQRVLNKEFKIFPVGIGKDFNSAILEKISPLLKPKQINTAEEFSKLFELLSSSSSRPEDDSLGKWWNDEA